LFEKAFVKGDI